MAPQLWSPTASHTAPNPIPQGLLHLGQALVCLLLHVGLTHAGLGASALTSDWFFELPYLGRFGAPRCPFPARPATPK